MKTGKVKFFNTAKGFGFIQDDETQTDYFVHISGLKDTIKEDDMVIFDLASGPRGLNATNVKIA